MEELQALFGEDSLNYEEFSKKLGEAQDSIKLANLKTGNYIDKSKYEKMEKSISEYKTKYDALMESTKGYEDLQNNYNKLKEDFDALQNKANENEKMSLISKANVNQKFAKFVFSEVSAMENESKDFQTALSEYLKDNKEFLNTTRHNYVDLEKDNPQPKSANEKMNDFIRGKR